MPNCNSCGWYKKNKCQKNHFSSDKDFFCNDHMYSEPLVCETCGSLLTTPYLLIDKSNNIHTYCGNCYMNLQFCTGCTQANICPFQSDSSSLPKTIQQQVRNGNAIYMTETINSERVEVTCKKLCKCYNAEFGCMKEFNWCGNHDNKLLGGSFYEVIS